MKKNKKMLGDFMSFGQFDTYYEVYHIGVFYQCVVD